MAIYMNDVLASEKVAIKLTPPQRQWLEDEARRERRSMNQVLRLLIEEKMAATPVSESTKHK